MPLVTADAEATLRSRLGKPAKPPTDYVIGFSTPTGKVLALHREASETRIWFEPPAPPKLDGVRLMDNPSNGNSNINGPLCTASGRPPRCVSKSIAPALWTGFLIGMPVPETLLGRLWPLTLTRLPSAKRSHASRDSSRQSPVIRSKGLTKDLLRSGKAISRVCVIMPLDCFEQGNGRKRVSAQARSWSVRSRLLRYRTVAANLRIILCSGKTATVMPTATIGSC